MEIIASLSGTFGCRVKNSLFTVMVDGLGLF